MTAYDDSLIEIGNVTATKTQTPNKAVFLGLQSTVNIRRIVITEAADNGSVGIFDDLRYESVADEPTVTTVATDASAAELGPDTATLVISRGSGEATTADRLVQGTMSGTAAKEADYTLSAPGGVAASSNSFEVTIPAGQTSVTVTVTPVFDPAMEGPETATFTVEGRR